MKNNKISLKIHNLFIGTILGDGSVRLSKSKRKTQITFQQSIEHIDYLFSLHAKLVNYTNYSSPLQRVGIPDNRYGEPKINLSYHFSTKPLAELNIYSDMFLNCNGDKTIPYNIAEHINLESLAYWIMDDGQKVTRGGITLCTDSYTIEEIELLRNALKQELNLTTTVHRKKGKGDNRYYNRIYISKNLAFKSISINLKKYMHPTFYYKLPVYLE